jgi:hypothetical protein
MRRRLTSVPDGSSEDLADLVRLLFDPYAHGPRRRPETGVLHPHAEGVMSEPGGGAIVQSLALLSMSPWLI